MIKDFSHDLSDTEQYVEQMVQQMMDKLSNIQLARIMAETVQYNCLRHFTSSFLLVIAR